MLEATCYVLENKKVTPCQDTDLWQRFMDNLSERDRWADCWRSPGPCQDTDLWQRFMDNLSERTVGSSRAGKFGVLTTFVGVNLGSQIMPKFFRTVITGDNGDNDPWLTETWEEAIVTHRTVVRAGISLTQASRKRERGEAAGYKVVDFSILPDDELGFVLESEEAAIKMLHTPSQNWSREGKTVTFHPRRNKKSATVVTDDHR